MKKEIYPIWQVIKTGDTLEIVEYSNYKRYISTLKDGELELVVRRAKRNRSNSQNSYYWGVVIPLIAEEIGELINEDVHNILREKFLKKGVDILGNRYEIVRSTADLSTMEFEKYLKEIRLWASMELSVKIPLPNEAEN